jgi:hypothetical protein
MADITFQEQSLSRLKKLKALAERGVGGEKENAQMLLERLCDKYQISPDQVESSDEKKLRWFRYRKGPALRKLLAQCIFKTLGKDSKTFGHAHTRAREFAAECTAAEGIEIELDYDFYADALQKEMTRMLEMFIQKNSIFPPNVDLDSSGKEISEEDMLLYRSIKKQTRVLRIGNSPEEVIEERE